MTRDSDTVTYEDDEGTEHTMVIRDQFTSGVIMIVKDGKITHTFLDDEWDAIIEANNRRHI